MGKMTVLDHVQLFTKAVAGSSAHCAVPAGVEVDADEQVTTHQSDQGTFHYRGVTLASGQEGYILDMYLAPADEAEKKSRRRAKAPVE